MQKLKTYINAPPVGSVTDAKTLAEKLAPHWDEFDGSDAESMQAYKLHGDRMENVTWQPPVLTFRIERHGSTVRGSKMADIHEWEVNLHTRTANCAKVSSRLLHAREPKLDTDPLAQAVVDSILSGDDDGTWSITKDGNYRIATGVIIPDEGQAKQTLAGRRRRLRDAVDALIEKEGFTKVRTNVFRPPAIN